MTAGHLLYDRDGELLATTVDVYASYHGSGSVHAQNVQRRQGIRALVPHVWYNDEQRRSHDLAFIKLQSPFDGVTPFKWCATPEKGNEALTVIGFPTDKGNDDQSDKGGFMYEETAVTEWDLSTSAGQKLDYRISTYGGKQNDTQLACSRMLTSVIGQSGAPVVCEKTRQCIGTHVVGFKGKETTASINSASPIGPQHGNHYAEFLEILSRPLNLEDGVLRVYGNSPVTVMSGPSRVTKKHIQFSEAAATPSRKTLRRREKAETSFATLSKRHSLSLPVNALVGGIADGQVLNKVVSANAFQKHRRNTSLPTNCIRRPEMIPTVC